MASMEHPNWNGEDPFDNFDQIKAERDALTAAQERAVQEKKEWRQGQIDALLKMLPEDQRDVMLPELDKLTDDELALLYVDVITAENSAEQEQDA